jgi:hypothetical protein
VKLQRALVRTGSIEFTLTMPNQPISPAVTNADACLRWLARDTPNLEEARAAAMEIAKEGMRAAEIITRIRLLFKKGTPQRESWMQTKLFERLAASCGAK